MYELILLSRLLYFIVKEKMIVLHVLGHVDCENRPLLKSSNDTTLVKLKVW